MIRAPEFYLFECKKHSIRRDFDLHWISRVVPWKSAGLFHHFASKSVVEKLDIRVERSPARLLSHLAPCTRVRWHRLQFRSSWRTFPVEWLSTPDKKKKKDVERKARVQVWRKNGYRGWIWKREFGVGVLPVICHCWRNFFTSEERKNFRNSADNERRCLLKLFLDRDNPPSSIFLFPFVFVEIIIRF